MSVVKRQGDGQGEDHTEERHPPVDWKIVAPRWALVTFIGVLIFAFGVAWGRFQRADDERITIMGRYQNDARWDLLVKHTEQISELQRAVTRHENQLEKLAAMAEDVRVLRRIAESTRKRNGGYGL